MVDFLHGQIFVFDYSAEESVANNAGHSGEEIIYSSSDTKHWSALLVSHHGKPNWYGHEAWCANEHKEARQ